MKYNELNIAAHKNSKRLGRGIASGKGKTAGRGTKGQNARKSGGVRPGFEGGQNPLTQRLPKLPGFKSLHPKMENIYTGQLDSLESTVIDNFSLADAKLVSSPYVRVKLISKGEVSKKVDVKIQAASKTAISAIQKAGGSFKAVPQVARQATSDKTKK